MFIIYKEQKIKNIMLCRIEPHRAYTKSYSLLDVPTTGSAFAFIANYFIR